MTELGADIAQRRPWSVVWLVVIGAMAAVWLSLEPPATPAPTSLPSPKPESSPSVTIDAVAVPLHPGDPSVTSIGDFHYAGGLWLRSTTTDQLHELSDITITGTDRLAAVGDGGIVFEAQILFDKAGRLASVTNGSIAALIGTDGKPLSARDDTDAEAMALLANGDRLIGFERNPRILLYPASGGWPRVVPSPAAALPFNAGIEALTADPESGADAYAVGAEESGDTWRCRVSAACMRGLTVPKAPEFGLVAMRWLPEGRMAYLLRAYDPVRENRIVLKILRGDTQITQLELAAPLTVDNFEGLTSVTEPDGHIRFYIVSDDNGSEMQRTLLFAFDWRPR